jgi:hypothetical protein
LAQQIGSNNFILQTDCAYVADTMKNGGYSATTSAAIYDDRNTFWSGFELLIMYLSNIIIEKLIR